MLKIMCLLLRNFRKHATVLTLHGMLRRVKYFKGLQGLLNVLSKFHLSNTLKNLSYLILISPYVETQMKSLHKLIDFY